MYVHSVPRRKKNGAVRAISDYVATASSTVLHPIPVHVWKSVNSRNTIVREKIRLVQSFELLHSQDEKRPLIGKAGMQLSYFVASVYAASTCADDWIASTLPLANLVCNESIIGGQGIADCGLEGQQ